jgi:hypothetical protein
MKCTNNEFNPRYTNARVRNSVIDTKIIRGHAVRNVKTQMRISQGKKVSFENETRFRESQLKNGRKSLVPIREIIDGEDDESEDSEEEEKRPESKNIRPRVNNMRPIDLNDLGIEMKGKRNSHLRTKNPVTTPKIYRSQETDEGTSGGSGDAVRESKIVGFVSGPPEVIPTSNNGYRRGDTDSIISEEEDEDDEDEKDEESY